MTYNQKTIEQLIDRFETRTLPKANWTHEAHIVVALWYTLQDTQQMPIDVVRQHIIAYNDAVGTPNTESSGYHETLTRFWLLVVTAYVQAYNFNSLPEALNSLLVSRYASSTFPFDFYSKELLVSSKARQQWVEPDRLPLEQLSLIFNTPKEPHFELSDEAFEQQFEACTLPPAIFSHEAHLRLAWIHIRKYGPEKAVETVCRQLINYVDSVGARDKYNQTLTVAAVRAVSHFISRSDADTFYDFIRQFPRLKNNFKTLIASHYQVDIYNSDLAKRTFIEPDLLPFT